MLAKLREMKQDEGFTLVELLVVIAILGVLAGIVVFSVAGLNDNSQASACKTEAQTVRTAEEAYYQQQSPKTYTDGATLQSAKLLTTAPSLVSISLSPASGTPKTGYSLAWAGACTTTSNLPATP